MIPLWLLLGCGDVLVDGDYPGEPLLTVTGQILVEATISEDVSPSVALFWTQAGSATRTETSVEVTTRFPAYFELNAYQPPVDADFFTDPQGLHLALGVLLLYDDTAQDGTLDVDTDTVIGAAADDAHVVWFPDPPEAQPDTPEDRYLVAHGVPECQGPPDTADEAPPTESQGIVDLLVADPCTLLPDWNCNGDLEEWGDLCGD